MIKKKKMLLIQFHHSACPIFQFLKFSFDKIEKMLNRYGENLERIIINGFDDCLKMRQIIYGQKWRRFRV